MEDLLKLPPLEPEPAPEPTPEPEPTPAPEPDPVTTPVTTPIYTTPEVSPSVQLVDGTYQIEFGSRWQQNQKFIFTISNNGETLTYDPPQSYIYTWNNKTKKYMDGRYFLDFKEDLSVFDNNEKGIYFATKIVPQPEPEVAKGVVIDGYVRNASIYQDKDYDGIPDDSELLGTTDVLGNFDISDVIFDNNFTNLGAPILMAVGGIDTSSLKPNIITLKTYPEKDKSIVLSMITTLVVKLAQDPLRPDINTLDKAKEAFAKAWLINKDALFDDPIKTLNIRVFEIINYLTLYTNLTTLIETSTQNRSVIIEDTLMAFQRILLKGVGNAQIFLNFSKNLKI